MDAFSWEPERIVVPSGQSAPFQIFDGMYEGISSTIGGDGALLDHLTLSQVENEEGDLEDALVIIDHSEVADADVVYVWRLGPMRNGFDWEKEQKESLVWGHALQAFVVGFAYSRMELLKQRYPDRQMRLDINFTKQQWTPDHVRKLVADDE